MSKVKKLLPVVVVSLLIAGLCVYYSAQKAGMFIDEIYTYGLSNSEYKPFVFDISGGDLTDQTITRQQFLDYLTVQKGEQFHFGSVYYNQTQDVHPPLHYWLIHTVSSFFPDSFSKWIGLGVNGVVFAATLVMLFMLTQKLFENRRLAVLTAALYGLSTIALSTMLMIRMYMLLTFFTVLLAWLIAKLLNDEKRSVMLYVAITLTVLLGLMTQYYYVFYAFFVCAAYDIYVLIKKQWRSFWAFSVAAIAGVALMLICYPACIDHLFADKLVSGASAIDNIRNVGDYWRKIYSYYYGINYNLRWAVRLGKLAAVAAVIRLIWDRLRKMRTDKKTFRSLVLTVPALISLVVVAVVSPVIPLRYIYNLIPLFVVLVAFALHICFEGWNNVWLLRLEEIAIAGVVTLSLVTALQVSPEFLNKDMAGYTEIANDYAALPCVYLEEDYASPLTQDMVQLLQFDDVFVTDRTDSEALDRYLEGHENNSRLVLYIDTDLEWSSGFDEKEVLDGFESDTEYVREEKLYGFGSSVVWLMGKKES